MCGCLDKELTEFPLIKSRIYLCIMTTNARTRVAPKIILSFLYIPGLYYIISMGLIWTEREAQWERESIFETHTSTHTICVWMRYIPVLRYMFSPTLPNSLLLLPGLWPLRQVLAHFCATLASSELHFCITDTKKFTLTKYHKKCKKKIKIPRTKLLRGSYLRKPAVSEHASLLASPKPTGFSLLRAV